MKKLCYLGIDPSTGRQIRKWASGNTDRDILNAEMTLKVQYHTGQIAAKDMKFDKWAQTWLDAKYPAALANQNTRRMYAQAVNHIIDHLGAMKMSRIRQIIVDQYLAKRTGRAAEQCFMVLKRIVKDAIDDGYIGRDPTTKSKLQAYAKVEKRDGHQPEKQQAWPEHICQFRILRHSVTTQLRDDQKSESQAKQGCSHKDNLDPSNQFQMLHDVTCFLKFILV